MEVFLKDNLQVLRVHVLLVAPLGASHMAKPDTDQHQSRVTVRETAYHTDTAADFPVQPLNDIVGTDACLVFTGKIAVGQGFLNAILYLFRSLLQLHGAKFFHHSFGFLPGSSFTLLGMNCLEFATSFTLE